MTRSVRGCIGRGSFPRDPDFATKTGVALDLYAWIFDGKALEGDRYVVCADEKTSIRCRCHPALPPGAARLMRVDHEYDRGGAFALDQISQPARVDCLGGGFWVARRVVEIRIASQKAWI